MVSNNRKFIMNRAELLSQGNILLREKALEMIEAGLQAADPCLAVKRLMQIDGQILTVGHLRFNLKDFEHIYILGAGKASLPIAIALEEMLGSRIADGLFVLKYGSNANLKHTRVIYGAHPIPDEGGQRGARALMALAQTFIANDLIFAGITGGSSALLPLPIEGVSLQDKQEVNRQLLLSGADITEINAVRKHLSRIKGGWLAKAILPATLVNLTVSDVVGDMLDYITDPTVADTSTFADARRVLDHYELWKTFPESATSYLCSGSNPLETPKDFSSAPLHSFIIANGASACLGAARCAQEMGFSPMILTTLMKGEAREAGILMAAIAREIVSFGRPIKAPCALIAGGENTVTIRNNYGLGGPNQEFVLASSADIGSLDNVLLAAIDTDGIDGPTDFAGAMVDNTTETRAKFLGFESLRAVHDHNATPLLQAIGDTILTGDTGTNVNDLKILLVG